MDMPDELGLEIKQRIQREVQTILRPLFDEVAKTIREQTAVQRLDGQKVDAAVEPIEAHLGTVRIQRPEFAKFARMTVPDSDNWFRMVSFSKKVDTWSIHNLGTTDLYYAYGNNASDYNTLGANDFAAKDTRPLEIWAKRATSGNTISVLIEWWEYAEDE
ncbi:MAG: hypothetical protein UY48_C0011G0001 [Candidatus Gottesmanbacteria bacterium GW2011_GWB1_49_7]|uniref:Uncharacterized protein n=1 Tax=Candidatus Gottesmanbacteria bacterium GW2011_GWB1_49_7 TaxID=1618448 RepID=A0A0G1Z1H4_9BACT|nr:MAG: hypothetical protein UY48_C0011G0001 [Candidatus Gottesmanbacteria bacterium GW2011_GWB1_49_7]